MSMNDDPKCSLCGRAMWPIRAGGGTEGAFMCCDCDAPDWSISRRMWGAMDREET
jgi:hypothetical protein